MLVDGEHIRVWHAVIVMVLRLCELEVLSLDTNYITPCCCTKRY